MITQDKSRIDITYLIFRIAIGLLFLQFGLIKLGLLHEGARKVLSFMWFIGIFETVIGIFIFLGWFTRIFASGGIIIMLGAYFTRHAPLEWLPAANNGTLALVFVL